MSYDEVGMPLCWGQKQIDNRRGCRLLAPHPLVVCPVSNLGKEWHMMNFGECALGSHILTESGCRSE